MSLVILVLTALIIGSDSENSSTQKPSTYMTFLPCVSDRVMMFYKTGAPIGEENQYQLHLNENFNANSKVHVWFTADATVELLESTADIAKVTRPNTNEAYIEILKNTEVLILLVKGPTTGAFPYVLSIVIDNFEFCDEPKKGFLDRTIEEARNLAELLGTYNPDVGCGRRKIQHIEEIVDGSATRPGDWPWHVAIYRFERSKIEYICGGTLITTYFVLTAAHCVTSRGLVVLPETRNVVLGKYNLVGGDVASQEKQIQKIIIHEGYDPKTVDRDIALMKLKTAVEFTDYVQPACLWYPETAKKVTLQQIYGTVVGWGFDHTENLSLTLQQVVIPEVSDTTCIKSNAVFFSKKLDGTRFCAGFANGTSVCNGDSGGGFHVFIPDRAGNTADDASGAWYVKGLVSLGIRKWYAAVCDPEAYSLFTDLSKYDGWINGYIEKEKVEY